MYPHARIILSSIVFSASLGLLVVGVGFLLSILETSGAFGPRQDDSPLFTIVFLVYVVAPALALVSLVVSVPASYLLWHQANRRFPLIALTLASLAYALVAWALLPASAVTSTLVAGTIFASVVVLAGYIWKVSLPRSNKSLERTREG